MHAIWSESRDGPGSMDELELGIGDRAQVYRIVLPNHYSVDNKAPWIYQFKVGLFYNMKHILLNFIGGRSWTIFLMWSPLLRRHTVGPPLYWGDILLALLWRALIDHLRTIFQTKHMKLILQITIVTHYYNYFINHDLISKCCIVILSQYLNLPGLYRCIIPQDHGVLLLLENVYSVPFYLYNLVEKQRKKIQSRALC